MSPRRSASLAACALIATGAAPAPFAAAQSSSPKPHLGIYDCYSGPSLDYDSSIKLVKGGRYEHTLARNGKTMTKASKGTYAIKGKRMTFRRGVLNGVRAEIRPPRAQGGRPFFNILAKNGKPAGITCTYTESANR